MNREAHWNNVYIAKAAEEVSWYQAEPKLSLELIRRFCPSGGRVIDVGGGESVLVDRLLHEGFKPAVLDVSAAAIEHSKARLGGEADRVDWMVADVTEVSDVGRFDLWHDRAVFHFLTELIDRQRYVQLVLKALSQGGHLLLATFAPDGPTRCSGLDVCRYDGESATKELGPSLQLVEERRETHLTPACKPQQFFYGVFQRR